MEQQKGNLAGASTGSSEPVLSSPRGQIAPASPLPWHQDRFGAVLFGDSHSRVVLDNFAIRTGHSRPETKQNTEYVLHACNAYPKLVAMLQRYLSTADKPLGISDLADIDAETRALLKSLGK